MALKTARACIPALLILVMAVLACNIPGRPAASPTPAPVQEINAPQVTATSEAPTLAPDTPTASIVHLMKPSDSPPKGQLVYDVVSEDTAPEKRAPYGDSYDINRLERPFLQDMTYVPDLDIETYIVSQDDDWWYVSLDLVGIDPNNPMGINYGIELDKNHDGFGDAIIWGTPPFELAWDTIPVKIFEDHNRDSAGLTGSKSDAPITTNGYETLVFDGAASAVDPDIAWVRMHAGTQATVQFAFKKSWSGTVFMLGVVADAGTKDVQRFDLVDRYKEQEAGSPVRDKMYYPLKALFAVDNVCREAFGFKATGEEPQLCPREEAVPRPHRTSTACTNPGQYTSQSSCEAAGCRWYAPINTILYVPPYCVAP